MARQVSWRPWTAFAAVAAVAFFTVALLAYDATIGGSTAGPSVHLQRRAPIANNILLRVLPIGDSITYGAWSTDYNGYRKPLHESMQTLGNPLDFVGAESEGDFTDNQHEGWRGKLISEIQGLAGVGIYSAPNIVLLHAGTNDMKVPDGDFAGAPGRLSDLINYIYAHSPNALVLVAQIVPCQTKWINDNINAFNAKVPGVVSDWSKKGKNIRVVDMNTGFDVNHWMGNYLHPNDQGYAFMASQWYKAILAAKADITLAGKVQKPPPSAVGSPDCKSTPAWINYGQLATGARVAYDDGPFVQDWTKLGVISEAKCDPGLLHFADLNGDGLKDWVCVDQDDGQAHGQLNTAKPGSFSNSWSDKGTVAAGAAGRNGSGVFFADMNADGKDDYIYVDSDSGNVQVLINEGEGSSGWNWKPLGIVNGNDVGARPWNLQMADLNGDGKADFMIIDDKTGAVTGWLNGGSTSFPEYRKIGEIATGATAQPGDKIVIGDFTGDGRADYMIVGSTGTVTGLVNRRVVDSLIPRWSYHVTVADGPSGATQQYVRMVDLNGDGKADYVLLDKNGKAQAWINEGSGGKYQIGDGVFLADLDGDGVNDYVWSDARGNAWGYLNIGQGRNEWSPQGQVKYTDAQGELYQYHMAPLTSSKRADWIIVDDYDGLTMWEQNKGRTAAGWLFEGAQTLATGPRHTIETVFGWHFDSRRVRFADMTGDGVVDYLYVDVNGAVVMWKNQGGTPITWGPATKIADGPSKGVWFTEIQFADADGDGAADYVAVDRFTGESYWWRNLGPRADGSIAWDYPASFADGTWSVGSNIKIVDMTGDTPRPRADFVSVDPDNGGLWLWKNGCFPTDQTAGGDGGDTPPDQVCPYIVENGNTNDPASWAATGAASRLDNFILDKGNNNWLQVGDIEFEHGGNDTQAMDCGDISDGSNCPSKFSCGQAPDPVWWYVEYMMSQVQTFFEDTDNAMAKYDLENLETIGQIANDFNIDPPDTSQLSKSLADISAVAGIAGGIAGALGPEGAGVAAVFGLIGGASSLATNYLGDDDPTDIQALTAAIKANVVQTLTNMRNQLSTTLRALNGLTSTTILDQLYTMLHNLNSTEFNNAGGRATSVGRLLDGGAFLSRIDSSTGSSLSDQVDQGIKNMAKASLGQVLTALQYMVVAPLNLGNGTLCRQTPSARFIDDRCHYFAVRPKGYITSQDVSTDDIDKIEKHYSLQLEDLMANVRDCNNRYNNPADKTALFLSSPSNPYPPCFFGLPYVTQSHEIWDPLWFPDNNADLPSWIGGDCKENPDVHKCDQWDTQRQTACKDHVYYFGDSCLSGPKVPTAPGGGNGGGGGNPHGGNPGK